MYNMLFSMIDFQMHVMNTLLPCPCCCRASKMVKLGFISIVDWATIFGNLVKKEGELMLNVRLELLELLG